MSTFHVEFHGGPLEGFEQDVPMTVFGDAIKDADRRRRDMTPDERELYHASVRARQWMPPETETEKIRRQYRSEWILDEGGNAIGMRYEYVGPEYDDNATREDHALGEHDSTD